MVITNIHTAARFNNSDTSNINSITPPGAVPNSHTSISPPFLMNSSSPHIPLQNIHPISSHMRYIEPSFHDGQCSGSFRPRQCFPNVNSMAQNVNATCQFQSSGQSSVPNSMIPTQNFNPNASFPNRPFCSNNPMQNTDHILSMQTNNGLVLPFNAHPFVPCNAQFCNPTLLHPNQVAQSMMGPQNPPIITNPPFFSQSNGVGQPVNQTQHNFCQGFLSNAPLCLNSGFDSSLASQNPVNLLHPSSMGYSSGVGICNSNQGVSGNPSQSLSHISGLSNQAPQFMGPQNFGIVANSPFPMAQNSQVGKQMGQYQNNVSACQIHIDALNQRQMFAHNHQEATPTFCQPQQTFNKLQPHLGSQVTDIGNGGINVLHSGYKNSQTKNFIKNSQKGTPISMQKSHFHTKHNKKSKFTFSNKNGQKGFMNDKEGRYDHANVANQTRREIRKSLPLNYTEQEIQQWKEDRKKNYPSKVNLEKKFKYKDATTDSELRRQQLKEILAKQAELGVEIAEIPREYLLSDAEKHKGKQEKREKKGKFQKNRRKRGMRRVKDPEGGVKRRKLSLLQKLVSGDTKRDGRRLAQVFRFMVCNSFFKHWPEEPLSFPTVVVHGTTETHHHLQPTLTHDGIKTTEI